MLGPISRFSRALFSSFLSFQPTIRKVRKRPPKGALVLRLNSLFFHATDDEYMAVLTIHALGDVWMAAGKDYRDHHKGHASPYQEIQLSLPVGRRLEGACYARRTKLRLRPRRTLQLVGCPEAV